MRETAKEPAQLDGAFSISSDGIILSVARYISADAAGIDLPLGLGARHMAAAAFTRATRSVVVVVSLTSVVRVFTGVKSLPKLFRISGCLVGRVFKSIAFLKYSIRLWHKSCANMM